jgi:L-iditol 2-dehydrogenase
MRVARLFAVNDLRLQEEDLPVPGPGEQLLHVRAVGICGSDLHWFQEGGIGDARLERSLVLGHEFSGQTASGQLVAVDPSLPCGQCEFCLKGNPNLCPYVRFAGHANQDGGLREYIAWDERRLYTLPQSLSAEDGVLLEPLGVALHAVGLAKLQSGMTVGVYGCGPIGLLILQLARLYGAGKIIATDALPHRVRAAESYGADQAYLSSGKPDVGLVMAVTSGRGVDLAFEVAGVPETVDLSVASVVPGGTVVLVGIPEDDSTSFSASTARRKGLTIKLARRMQHSYPRAIDLVSRGLLDVRSLVTHRFPLQEAPYAFKAASQRIGLKTIIEI